jgi:hypothetical protein
VNSGLPQSTVARLHALVKHGRVPDERHVTIGTPESTAARAGLLLVGAALVWFLVYRCLEDGVLVSRWAVVAP